jgi:hypothetical protein
VLLQEIRDSRDDRLGIGKRLGVVLPFNSEEGRAVFLGEAPGTFEWSAVLIAGEQEDRYTRRLQSLHRTPKAIRLFDAGSPDIVVSTR